LIARARAVETRFAAGIAIVVENACQNLTTKAVIKAFLMMPGLFIAVQCYRIVLFFVTMWTL
jgi:hypothetical protein